MVSPEARELKYTYRFTLKARPKEPGPEQPLKLELQDYINELLGILNDKDKESRR
jgi:hypothetical protein